MGELMFELALCAFMMLLGATPLFRGSRRQKQYEKAGMGLIAYPRGRIVILPAIACLCSGMVAFFAVCMWQEGGFLALAGEFWFLILIGVIVLLDAACFLGAYVWQSRHVLYDEKMLLIGRPFREYREIRWYEISKIEIINQDFFNLCDRDGRRCVQASADMQGYSTFYHTAISHVHPEYAVAAGEGTAYENHFTPVNGCGMLCPRAGEYWGLLAVTGLLMLFVAGMFIREGAGAGEVFSILLEEKLYGALILPLGFAVSVLGLVWAGGRKITYDRTEIVWYRFGRKIRSLRRGDIQKITAEAGRNGLRTLTFYLENEQYRIREAQFRKGFSEFFAELVKEHENGRDT